MVPGTQQTHQNTSYYVSISDRGSFPQVLWAYHVPSTVLNAWHKQSTTTLELTFLVGSKKIFSVKGHVVNILCLSRLYGLCHNYFNSVNGEQEQLLTRRKQISVAMF